MTHDPIPRPARHSRRSAETWAAARADYLAGATAAEVCERHGLSVSTFRWRARTEGWRLADQPHGTVFEPFCEEELAFQDTSLPCNAADMARLAWSNASRAMRDSRLIEARGWTRLHNDLVALADADSSTIRAYRHWSQKPETVARIPVTPPLRPMEED